MGLLCFLGFQIFGHTNAKVMDGGRKKWLDEGRETTKEKPSFPPTVYKPAARADYKIRAFRDQVMEHVERERPLVDVRSPQEFSGELLHMPGSPQEGALRGGHIRGAVSVPWSRAVAEDGTFKPPLNCGLSMKKSKDYRLTKTLSPTAVLVNAVPTPGLH